MRTQMQNAAHQMIVLCFSALLVPAAAAQRIDSHPPIPHYDFSPVRAYIQKIIADKQLPSVSVAVAKKGKIIWEEAFGWADREKMIPATPDTIYALASLTKPYTSTGVMELVEHHKIDLDRVLVQ